MVARNTRIKIHNRISELRDIEQKAKFELTDIRLNRFYDGKANDLDRLEKIIRDARIELLELELKNRLPLHNYDYDPRPRPSQRL